MVEFPTTFTGWLVIYGQCVLAIFIALIITDISGHIFGRKKQ